MKKNLFLTLMLTLLCTAAGWAQFSPEQGKMYAFREVTSGLFLDIQSWDVHEPGYETWSISLNSEPRIIYFEDGDTPDKFVLKNAEGTYAQQKKDGRDWNAIIGWDRYQWTIADADGDGFYTIARADGLFIGMDNPTNRAPLYCNRPKGLEFALVEFGDLVDMHTSVKLKHSAKELYMNCTEPNAIKLQSEATPLHILTSGSYFVVKVNDTDYLAQVATEDWDDWSVSALSKEPYLWLFSDADNNGAVSITKLTNWTDNRYLGNNDPNVAAGSGIWANVPTNCNKWLITNKTNKYSQTVPDFDAKDIGTIQSYGQYLTRLAINGMGVYTSSAAPSTAANMYVETPVTGISLEPGVEYKMSLTFPKNQTSQTLVANMWIDKDGDGTFETHLGTTGTEKSNSNDLSTVTFTIPANAAQGLIRIRLRLDSSWSIAEAPNAAANRMVYDIPVAITVAQPYTFYIDNPSDHAVNVKYNGEPILGGAKVPADVDTDLFTVPEIEGYTWEIVINNQNKSVTLVYVKKYSLHLVDAPLGVTITYDGNAITEGFYFENEFDSQKLQVSCEGYSWELSKDTEGKFVVVTFTALVTVENPEAVVALIKRIGGDGIKNKFKFILDPSLDYNKEVFVIGSEDGKILIKGTTISAITTGIGWYLNNYAHINIAWNSLNEKTASGAAYADLSNIPVPTAEERRTSDAKYRYYLNYCTFGYSMTTWTWKRWQQEIDWMALHGINMPLQIIGLEEVWRKFLTLEENGKRKYNYSNEEAKAFVPGPAFTAWWGMNNLEGWGGTAADGWGGVQDDAWYARQKALAKQICDRQRELGMQPVLPGFSGMVPTNFQTKTGVACDAGKWCSFDRPKIVLPSNERFAEIAADYYKCLAEVMGESQYYSIDPFHEGGSINGGEEQDYKDAYKAIYDAMEAAKPASQWVIQQWQWSHNNFQKYSLTAVPAGRLIVLDLFSDGRPEFELYRGYDPQEAVFCAVPNFGGRSGLMGRLNNVAENYFKFKSQYPNNIKGIAAAPEAIEQTPIAYDLVFQLPWMGSKPDVKEWVKNYATARYGVENAEAQAAWDLLRQGPLNYGADAIQGPVEDVWAARPNLDANAASTWGSTLSKKHGSNVRPDATYTKERQQMLIEATYKLLAQNGAITGDINVSNYNYDIVELGGAVMADYAHYLLLGIKAAKEAAGDAFVTDEKYIARKNAFLALIADVDEFKGTNLNFRLGKWTQEARDAAAEAVALGATSANADWYEYNNARTLITTWGDYAQNNSGGLRDYSYRSWQGLLKDYYLPRWEYYFNNGCTHPGNNVQNYFYFEWNWAHGLEHNVGNTSKSSTKLAQGKPGYSYTREPQGNTVNVAKELLGKYIIPVTTGEATTYAYRHLTNDLRATCTLSVMEGNTVNLCDYFGELKDATITAECIDGTATDAKNVIIKSGAANGAATKYDAQITLADGTVIDFVLVVNDETFMVAKDELAALIEKMESLTAQVATYERVKEEIGLSTTAGEQYYIYSNAEIREGNMGYLIDGITDQANNYIHTTWEKNSTDGLHHYLRVYLGDEPSLNDFSFSYVTRNNVNNEKPKQITVAGCDTENGSYETIAVLTDLPIESTETYESAVYNAKGYKFLRFMVDDTYRDLGHSGHKAYSMAEFDLFKVYTSADVYTHLEDVEGIAAAAVTAYDALLDAKRVYDNSMSQSEIDAAKTLLQEKYDALKELLGGDILPVQLTTDEANPVLYKIIIKRADDGSKVLGYDHTDGKVPVQGTVSNSSWQAWYFMSSTNGVTIHPYNADGKVLSADNTSNGAGKVWAVEKGSKTFYEWKFVKRTDDEYYNIQATNDAYFSNFGGVNNKMGFWDGDANESKTQNDGGSLFKFIDAHFENDNARYYQLHDLVNGVIPTQSDAKLNQMASGTAPGYYTGKADEFREAYKAANNLDTNGNTSPAADCYATYKALRDAYATGINMIMPTDGAVYRIRSYIKEASLEYKQHYVTVNDDVKIEFPTSFENSGAKALWVCVKEGEKYKFVSALGTAAYVWQGVGETALAFTIAAGLERGALCMKNSENKRLALTGEEWKNKGEALFNVKSDGEYNGSDKWSTDWYLEPVDNANVAFERDLNAGHHWGTLYLPYAVEVPYGITAYYATGANVADKVVELAEVENDIIPAYTPVLINRADDSVTETFSFYYTAEKGTAVTGNLFGGRVIESAVECEANKNYYLLLNASKGEAFYWVYKEFGANGQITNPGTHDGGHILCEANKAFLAIAAGSVNPAALSFRYGGDTTDIEEVKGENGKVKTIYDLQGRKLSEITEPGIYIVNGKKVLVK
ncbi:MAG: alpha-N-acetylglucosaminidase [Bacteroidaceae bacterium]|nr:alpha-N-acetylglucosaminidase [Bacteroidaceae bacterium]